MGDRGGGLYLHSCLKIIMPDYEEDKRKVQEYTTLKISRYGEFFSCIVQ